MDVAFFENGMTIAQLRELVKDLPDDGEVRIETGLGLSSVVNEVWPLNESDILLFHAIAFDMKKGLEKIE